MTKAVAFRFFCESVADLAPMAHDGKRHVRSKVTAQVVNFRPLYSSIDAEQGNSLPSPLELHIYDRALWGGFVAGEIYTCSFSPETTSTPSN